MLHAAVILLLVVFIGALAAAAIPYRAGSLRWARFFFGRASGTCSRNVDVNR